MSRARMSIRVDRRLVVVRGWRAAELLQGAGIKATFSGSAGGWMVDRQRLGDVLAYFESRNITVVITDVDQLELPVPPDGGEAA